MISTVRAFPFQSPNLPELLWLCLRSRIFLGLAFWRFSLQRLEQCLSLTMWPCQPFLGCIRCWALLWSPIPQTWAWLWGICQVIVGYLPLSLDPSAKANESSLVGHVLPSSHLFQLCISLDPALGRWWCGWRPLQPSFVTLTEQLTQAETRQSRDPWPGFHQLGTPQCWLALDHNSTAGLGQAAPFCSSAVTPKVWEAPGLQWDKTSVQKGLPLPLGIWLSQNSQGWWLSCLVLAMTC